MKKMLDEESKYDCCFLVDSRRTFASQICINQSSGFDASAPSLLESTQVWQMCYSTKPFRREVRS